MPTPGRSLLATRPVRKPGFALLSRRGELDVAKGGPACFLGGGQWSTRANSDGFSAGSPSVQAALSCMSAGSAARPSAPPRPLLRTPVSYTVGERKPLNLQGVANAKFVGSSFGAPAGWQSIYGSPLRVFRCWRPPTSMLRQRSRSSTALRGRQRLCPWAHDPSGLLFGRLLILRMGAGSLKLSVGQFCQILHEA